MSLDEKSKQVLPASQAAHLNANQYQSAALLLNTSARARCLINIHELLVCLPSGEVFLLHTVLQDVVARRWCTGKTLALVLLLREPSKESRNDHDNDFARRPNKTTIGNINKKTHSVKRDNFRFKGSPVRVVCIANRLRRRLFVTSALNGDTSNHSRSLFTPEPGYIWENVPSLLEILPGILAGNDERFLSVFQKHG